MNISPACLAGVKVLVIDDDEDSRKFVRFVFNKPVEPTELVAIIASLINQQT